jgi:hypothetical protein
MPQRIMQQTPRLQEPRVQRATGPLLAGTLPEVDLAYDDAYVRDLGLIAKTRPVRVANPIYREVIARVLAAGVEEQITARPTGSPSSTATWTCAPEGSGSSTSQAVDQPGRGAVRGRPGGQFRATARPVAAKR